LGHASSHVVASLQGCHALVLETNHDPDLLEASNYPSFLKQRVAGPWGHLANQAAAELLARAKKHGMPSPAHHPVLCDIDGVRIDWADGFGLVRASNTTPVLVLRFEGQTSEALARIQGDMMALLREVKPDAQVQEAAH
jgi:phosphomannomutase